MSEFNIKQAVPFFMVVDIQRSLSFYISGLGFRVVNTWEPGGQLRWCWLQREGAALMLQEYGQRVDAVRGIGVSICFQCVDALALYHEFVGRGLAPAEPFVGNNLWDVGLTDPDGYRLHFESPTDVPEETTYTQWKAGLS